MQILLVMSTVDNLSRDLQVNVDSQLTQGMGPMEGFEVVEGAGVVVQQVPQEGGSTAPGCG
jgi:hypothetical protein